MPCWPLIHVKSCTNIITIIWKYILYIQIKTKYYALGFNFITIRDESRAWYKQPLLNYEEECMTLLINYVNYWRNINFIKKLGFLYFLYIIFLECYMWSNLVLIFFLKSLLRKTILFSELNTVSINPNTYLDNPEINAVNNCVPVI